MNRHNKIPELCLFNFHLPWKSRSIFIHFALFCYLLYSFIWLGGCLMAEPKSASLVL